MILSTDGRFKSLSKFEDMFIEIAIELIYFTINTTAG